MPSLFFYVWQIFPLSAVFSYIDNYYGVITVENKDEYLIHEYHLNEKGIEAVADRFHHFFGNNKK